MKNWLVGLGLLIPSLLKADMIEVDTMEKVFPLVEEGTCVLLGMTDTIIDSSLSLGCKPWRHYIRRQLKPFENLDEAGNLHDQWTYTVAKYVPVKPIEQEIVTWIEKLQKEEVAVFCLTGRGRDGWYATVVPKIDELTEAQLKSIGIDFSKTKVPESLEKVDPRLFYHGIFYADCCDKGAFIDKILQQTSYAPKKIIVVDDKWDQLKGIEQKLNEAGIPHVLVLYQRAEKERKNFNPLIATLQLEALIDKATVLTDEQAAEKAAQLENPSADEVFKKFLSQTGHFN